MPMPEPIRVEPREGYKIWVEYDDGECGEVDLSDVAGMGVFQAWEDRAFFEQVRITEDSAIGWGGEIEVCPDRVYFDLTGKTPAGMMPGLRTQPADACATLG